MDELGSIVFVTSYHEVMGSNPREGFLFFTFLLTKKTFLTGVLSALQKGEVLFKSGVVTLQIWY